MRLRLLVHSDQEVAVRWGFTIWSGDHWVCVTGEADSKAHRLEPGESALGATIARLPLMPGRFAIRAVLIDAETGLVRARFGWEEPPLEIAVGAGGDPLHSAAARLQPLVTIDVDWD
jgi:hypothetical protein